MGFFGPPNIKKMEAKGDVEGLIKALKFDAPQNEGYDIRRRATQALIKIGEPSVKSLIQALKIRRRHVREQVAQALGTIGDVRAVESLIQAY